MPSLPPARIRIAADIFQFDNFTDALRSDLSGFIPKLRAGDDVQFEIALFNNGDLLTDLSAISSLHLEIKPLHAELESTFIEDDYEEYDLRGPSPNATAIRTKTIGAEALNDTLTPTQWETLAADQAHAIIALSSVETNLAPGDRWLTLAVTTTDAPAQTRTIAAGRIRILGGGRCQGTPPEIDAVQYYSAPQSDARYLRLSENLADLPSPSSAREQLELGSAALLDAIDEDDFASQSSTHLPTQQSVKAYIDSALSAVNIASARHGIMLDGTSGEVDFGDVFNQDMTSDWSVCGWFKTSSSTEQALVRKGTSAPYLHIGLTSTGKLRVQIDDGTQSATVDTAASFNNGLWHHFMISVDVDHASGLAIYVDGTLQTTGDPTSVGDLSNAAALFLGSTGAMLRFGGALRDFGFFSKALTADDALTIYQHGLGDWVAREGWGSVELTLPMDEGIGYQLHDRSGNHNDGLASTSGIAHLSPQAGGYIRSEHIDAYNGGTVEVELVSSTRDIIPPYAWITHAVVINAAVGTVNDIEIKRSNRSNAAPCLQTSATLTGGGGDLGHVIMADPSVNQQLSSRQNVIVNSTDPDATDLSFKVHYEVYQP